MPFDLASNPSRALAALALALVVSAVAERTGALARSGAVAATLIGSLLIAFGGWRPGILLVAFFVSSSIVTRVLEPRTGETARGSRRDAIQVLANGAVPVIFAATGYWLDGATPWRVATVAGITAAAADTWATGFGRLNRTSPRTIIGWRPVPPGTSGAISVAGTTGAAAAAMILGIPAGWGLDSSSAIPILVGSGLAGALIDSLLGATVQAQFWCPTCNTKTERAIHRCGTPTRLTSGTRWFDNDVVNASAIALAGLLAAFATWAVGG